MAAYESFARVYDELMDDVPYETWADFIRKQLQQRGIRDGLVLDLCCGTGRMTGQLRNLGYDMIGVDSSVDMLEIAREKTPADCLYLLQDMRDFELYGTVRAVVSVCDSINYITEDEDLLRVFKLVNNYLDPGGIFLFDVNTEYKYRDLIGDTVIAEDREDVSFIWYNDYDRDIHQNTIDLSVFVREEGDLFRKYREVHVQKGYGQSRIVSLLEESGLEWIGAFDGYSDRPAHEKSERIVFMAKEIKKTKEDQSNE